MPSNIVCSLSSMSVGCTFIDWSIHYLSSKDRYYSTKSKSWIDLVSNPLQKFNSHGHQKNHPFGFDSTRQAIQHLETLPDHLYSLYPVVRLAVLVAQELELDIHNFRDKSVRKAIYDYQVDDAVKLFALCCDRTKTIYVADDSRTANLFAHFSRQTDIKFTSTEKPTSLQELEDEQDQLWNADSIRTWESIGLTDIWDKRERRALDMRPAGELIDPFLHADFSLPHFCLTTRDLWANGEIVFVDMMDYLDLKIDPKRWDHWVRVYRQWRTGPSAIQRFVDNLDHVLECIVNGWQYPLPDLQFEQEAMIQHFLIYRYGLNLKTWQLVKFPNNTIDLHKLLEPNTHPLVNTYRDL